MLVAVVGLTMTGRALQLVAADFKDRWLVAVAAGSSDWALQHRLSDEAWINWDHNEFGWLDDGHDGPRPHGLTPGTGYVHHSSHGHETEPERPRT